MSERTPESKCKRLFFLHPNLQQCSCDRFSHVSRTYPYRVSEATGIAPAALFLAERPMPRPQPKGRPRTRRTEEA
jgi:hypothetical protein